MNQHMENTEKKMHRSSRKKIYSIEELEEISASLKMDGKTVVLCHGVFDHCTWGTRGIWRQRVEKVIFHCHYNR